ncbi:MAG: peptide deformylase [Solirubrobacteraceae bacterium]
MVRVVLRHPHPLLTQAAPAADPASAASVIEDLIDTMRSFPRCVGVAAPQIGELVRVAVVDCSEHPKADVHHGLLVLVNPVIAAASGSEVGREGCLSIPELTANVRRATAVTVEASGAEGEAVRLEAVGFEARALQHELDHLDGVLFLDRVESLEADVFERRNR